MKINHRFYDWLSRQNHNYAVIAAATFLAPRTLVRSIYAHNRARSLWGGASGCLTLSFDCDFPEDAEAIPKVVELLRPYGFKASFAVVGHWLKKFPSQHEAIVREGHEVMNHTWSHPDNEILNPGRRFREISAAEKADEVSACHECCAELLGVAPIGFRVPHFKNLFTPDIYPILARLGYTYSSSTWLTNTTTHGLPFAAPHGIVEFPLATSPLYPFTVFDTWHLLNSPSIAYKLKRRGPAVYLRLLRELLETAESTGSYLNVYLDPLDMHRLEGVRPILEWIARSKLQVVTYSQYLELGLPIVPTPLAKSA